MPLRLYNTLTRRLEEFRPADPSRVTFYSCGPTVYDDAHIGNFRSFLAADLLRRWIESPLCELAGSGRGGAPSVHAGPRRVVHVMNITDVGHMTDDAEGGELGEDRMAVAGRRLLEQKKQGKVGAEVDPADPYQIARYFEGRFKEDARKLGLKLVLEADKDPTLMPRATENVAGMIRLIGRLIGKGNAYVTGGAGSRVVYFRVKSFGPYGRLSGNTLDKLREGEGGRVSTENQASKEHPADFLLWKEDPSHIMKWESPWGWGYPGWHIECSVMSLRARHGGTEARRHEGEGTKARRHAGTKGEEEVLAQLVVADGLPLIDLHSGGEDNIFPHHECEIAQSCCAFNAAPEMGTYASMWFHPRFLLVEGTKMSKSKGNFFTARDLFKRDISPAAVRFELIRTHYRSNADFSVQRAVQSHQQIEAWIEAAAMLHRAIDFPWQARPQSWDLLETFAEALHDDLNIAKATSVFHSFFGGRDSPAAHFIRALGDNGWDVSSRGLTLEWISKLPDRPLGAQEALDELEMGRAAATFREAWAALHIMDAVLGVIFTPRISAHQNEIGVFAPGVAPDPTVIAKLEERRAARAAKDFARSDQIRDELAAMGYAIKDIAGGKVEVRRT